MYGLYGRLSVHKKYGQSVYLQDLGVHSLLDTSNLNWACVHASKLLDYYALPEYTLSGYKGYIGILG